MTDAVVVGEDVNRHKEGGASLPVRVFRCRILRWLGGKTCRYPSQFLHLSALMGLWAEATLKVGGHFPGRALVPWIIQGFRCRGSLEWGLVPRMDNWHGLLEEVWLKQQDISEAHIWPRECGEADQEVVALSARFPRGQAEL